MIEEEPIATTMIAKFYDTTTSFMGTYIVDRIHSTLSTMIGELGIAMDNCEVLSKKESFTLSQHDQEVVEQSIGNLQRAIKLFGEGINDWKFTNDMRALQLSVDDLAQMVEAAAYNTRNVASHYNWRKFQFILKDMGISDDIIKTIDDARMKYIIKSGRRKGERGDPFSQTRKWLKKILNGFIVKVPCEQCKHVTEVRDHNIIQYVEPDKSSRHAEVNNP